MSDAPDVAKEHYEWVIVDPQGYKVISTEAAGKVPAFVDYHSARLYFEYLKYLWGSDEGCGLATWRLFP